MKQKNILLGAFALAIGVGSLLALSQKPGITYADPGSDFFSGFFSGMAGNTGYLHRVYGGQDTEGLVYWKDLVAGSYTVELSGTVKTCAYQIRGIYINTARGNVIRPLDADSLAALQSIDSSYNALSMSGGLYTSCDSSTHYIYGQVNHSFSGLNHVLVAGVDVNTGSNTYNYAFGTTLQFINNTTVGYLVDGVNGVADVSGFGLAFGNTEETPPVNHGGGGSSTLSTDNCKLPSTLACANSDGRDQSRSLYDHTCCAIISGVTTGNIVVLPPLVHNVAGISCDIAYSPFSQEITRAFQRAYTLGIITSCPITDAHLEGDIPRKELAKMISIFATKILGLHPDTTQKLCEKFSDVSTLSNETKGYIIQSCQLGIMGFEANGITIKKKFDPNYIVNRAQFGTTLSRLIYDGSNNIHTGEDIKFLRYQKHQLALKKDNIMTQIGAPFMKERRSRVLMMLKRATDYILKQK